MQELLLFPFGGNAREAASVVQAINRQQPTFELLGFVDDNPELQGHDYHEVPVLGGREVLDRYPNAQVLACPGRAENFRRRDKIIALLDLEPERFATVLHPSVEVGLGSHIGTNCLLMSGVALTGNVTLGNHCVILPNTVVSHDVSVGDYTMIGSGVSVSGSVELGRLCYIGSGSKIIQEITIAEGSLVGLGAVVIRPTEPNSVVVGNPARPLPAEPA